MKLILASLHLEKIRELKSILQEALPDVHLISVVEVAPCVHEIIDENGVEKSSAETALRVVEKLSAPCLADASGLIIPCLAKEKVWREERISSGIFLPNTKKILKALKDREETERQAFLECSLSFATPENGLVRSVSCRMEGFIAPKEKGSSSFDFSSIFIKYEYSKTLAELTPSVQSRISHRRKACEKLLPFLRSYYRKNMYTETS